MSQLEATLRERLNRAADPLQALIAAAQLGEQQGVKIQLESAKATSDRLGHQLEAMTFRVAELESQLKAHAATRLSEQSAVEVGLDRLNASLEHLSTQLAPASHGPGLDIDELTTQVRRLIADLSRSRRRTPAGTRGSKPVAKPRKRPAPTSRRRARPIPSRKPTSKYPRDRGPRSSHQAPRTRSRSSR